MSEQFPEIQLDLPAHYHIYVTGILDSDWVERRWGMTSSTVEQRGEPDQTVLVGKVVDQAALIGVINALYNMGHTVVSVKRLFPDTDLPLDDTNMEA